VTEPVDRRIVHRDHGDVAMHLVFSRHAASFEDKGKRTVVRFWAIVGAGMGRTTACCQLGDMVS
jgi:hypothetical protein